MSVGIKRGDNARTNIVSKAKGNMIPLQIMIEEQLCKEFGDIADPYVSADPFVVATAMMELFGNILVIMKMRKGKWNDQADLILEDLSNYVKNVDLKTLDANEVEKEKFNGYHQ